jgi:Cation transporter/ATPase, N-terminus/E1-E2 ATPase
VIGSSLVSGGGARERISTMDVERNANVSPQGLTSKEAESRLRQYGPNAVREAKPHLLLAIAQKFWAPVPWMLEATIVLELILRKRPEAIIISLLLAFNACLGFVQENRAQNDLSLLRRRLPVKARGLRDGKWQLLSAEDLVPGDFIHVRTGDIMPADVRLDTPDFRAICWCSRIATTQCSIVAAMAWRQCQNPPQNKAPSRNREIDSPIPHAGYVQAASDC